MHIKGYVDRIVEHGDTAQMHELAHMFVKLVYNLKQTSPDWYKSIEYDLHVMACGEHLNEHMARKWVCKMENADGTKGAHWTFEQTEAVKAQKAYTVDCWDFYAILNMVYSDYYKQGADVSYYTTLAMQWLSDKDVGHGKALKYYIYIVQ